MVQKMARGRDIGTLEWCYEVYDHHRKANGGINNRMVICYAIKLEHQPWMLNPIKGKNARTYPTTSYNQL